MKKIWKLTKGIVALSAAAGVVALILDRKEAKKSKSKHQPKGFYEAYLKRPLDAFLSAGALIVLSPVLLGTAALVRIKLGSPVLFTQDRPGKDEKVFKLYKFRSMTDERDENGNLLPDEDRLPSFGKLLRSTSLDELPELLNILKGDMSIVGPRPLLVKYLPRYTEEQHRRHDVRPGLTGLAGATVRNAATWDEKFALDVSYVDNISFFMDLKIILMTAKIVLKREGINEENQATMSEFWGILGEPEKTEDAE